MAVLPAVRIFLFAGIVLFSVVVLAVIFNIETLSPSVPRNAALQLGIASAVATIVVIATTLIVDFIRRGKGVTSMVWFDLVRTFALWALWLSTAVCLTNGEAIESCQNSQSRGYGQSVFDASNTDASTCLLFRISQVSVWVATFLAFAWFIVLLTCSNVASARGFTQVWTSPLAVHPVGLRRSSISSSSTDSLPPYSSSEKFYPSPYGLLVSSYEHRGPQARLEKDGQGSPRRREEDVDFGSTSTITIQTVHLERPSMAVVSPTSPNMIDLEAQQPQPRRID